MQYFGREEQIAAEDERLSKDAARASASVGRDRALAPDVLRNDFQRDRDRILHTKAFRRLSHKTQVFLSPEGDHFRTRLTHTLEVAQIARTAARALSLNEDLTEAIALGHDLGHTPFGHCGETALTACLAQAYRDGMCPFDARPQTFHHNEQSVRVVELIENNGQGLNLTFEVRDGILHHTGDVKAQTLEGRIVAVAARVAAVNHEIDAASRAGYLSEEDLPSHPRELLGDTPSHRIDTLVVDLVETSIAQGDILMSPAVWDALDEMRDFLFANVYRAPRVMEEVNKASHMISELFFYFCAHPDEIPSEYRELSPNDVCRAACDHIAGMTDRYATATFERLFIPRARDSRFNA